MRATTVRIAADAYPLIHSAADTVGVSLSQFVREAAIIRTVLVLAKDEELDFAKLAAEVERRAQTES